MTITADSSPAVVALLLDDIAPPRLGTLLRAARKQRGLTRREVADRVDATPGDLRRFERGDTPVPPHLVAELAECYGEDLAAQFATRLPIEVDDRRITVGNEVKALESADTDEVLRTYVAIVARLRNSQPGTPIALRADDVVALSTALGQDADHVEARIVEILGCTAPEAHSLHMEMLRRKLVVPVAGLVAGLAVVTGVGVGVANASTNSAPQLAPAPITAPAPAHVSATPPTTVAAKPAAAPATAAPAVETPAVEVPAAPAEPTPTAAAPATPVAPAVVQSEPVATPAAQPLPRPVIKPDNTPMSIPANETVTVIQP
jgi:transcriptional regulator with XRE-family HTH domain